MISLLGGLIPLATLGLLISGIRRPASLDAIAPAALFWSLQAVVSLEVLSLLGLINWLSLFLFWTVSAGATAMLIARRGPIPAAKPPTLPDRFFNAFAAAATVIVVLTLIVGLLSVPNTVDSLRYHLPRIEQWVQQGSLANFPTGDHRQLASNPLAEMLILHFRLLSQSDYLDNLVQGLAFAGSTGLAAVVARRLGAAQTGQILAAVLVATLPMAILQGSSTQNDFVVSFFLLAAAERLLSWHGSGRASDGLGVGAAVGLAVLTKGTAFFFAAPIGVAVLVILIRRPRWKTMGVVAAMAALILVINAPHLYRNAQVILAPAGLVNTTASMDHGPGAVASSILRNAASNFVTPSASINEAMIHGVRMVHRFINRNADDPNTTLTGSRFGNLPRNILNGDVAPNPLHLLLILLAIGLAGQDLVRPQSRATPGAVKLYLAAVLAGGVIFCALLRWQPFIVRLQLPFFVLAMPVVGAILAARISRAGLIAGAAILIVAAIPFVICNQERPLYGNPARLFANHFAPNIISASSWELIFWDNPKRQDAFQRAVESVRDRAHGGVGLMPQYDYAFWRMLKGDRFNNNVHIENVCLPVEYAKLYRYRSSRFRPSVILTDLPQPEVMRCSNGVFERENSFLTGDPAPTAHVSVYRRRPD